MLYASHGSFSIIHVYWLLVNKTGGFLLRLQLVYIHTIYDSPHLVIY